MAFNLNGERWDHTTITWSIATFSFSNQPGGAFSSSISDPIIINDIANAFNQWDAASGLSFVRVADASDVDIRLGFGPIDGFGGAIGRARINTRDGSYTKSSDAVESPIPTAGILRTR